MEPQANPFLSWRAIRISLSQPELFKNQLRAILRVADEYPIKVMFPMISILQELRRTKSLIAEAGQELATHNILHAEKIEMGIIVEIPAVVQMADLFACEVDFFSIGTNDLKQYTFAVVRTNPLVAPLAVACHPAVLRQIQKVVEAARSNGAWVGVYGELASVDPPWQKKSFACGRCRKRKAWLKRSSSLIRRQPSGDWSRNGFVKE